MAVEWREAVVADIAAPTRNALVGGPFGSNLVSRDYVSSGVPVIRGQNMGQRWVSGEFAFVTEEKAQSLEANLARPGDIVFTQRGTLGQVSIVPSLPYPKYLVSQSQMKLTVDNRIADPVFVYYVFRSADQQEYIARHAIQVGVPHTNLGILRATPVNLPPLSEQRAIAHILGSLDDKIELNRRMNETLEAMARALFKSWFVDFDPVRAKAEGRDTGLPQEIADLFPSRLVESELGEIPEGWLPTTLGAVTSKIGSGATPRGGKAVYVDSGTAFIRSQNVYDSQFEWEGLAHITDEAADSLDGVTVQPEDVLLNITGASFLRTCVVDPDVLPSRVNQHVCIIRPMSGMPSRYIHLQLLRHSTKSYLSGLDAGASRQAVTKGHIESVPLVTPSPSVLELFARVTRPLFLRISNGTSQSRTLAVLRDTLLPKLISGQLRVKEAAEQISEATEVEPV